MNKIAICIAITLVLGTGLAGATLGSGQDNVKADTIRVVIGFESQNAKASVIKAVESVEEHL